MNDAPRKAPLLVIGGGLAGCEAAWQIAQLGVPVELCEMRPHRRSPAHVSDALAELVCSNSLRGAALENAVGLLKEELFVLDSLIIASARQTAVPAGGALAVDRELFGAAVEARLTAHPLVTLRREEVTTLSEDRSTIVACGPLPSDALAAELDALITRTSGSAQGRLHYYDAASPIVETDSLDRSVMYEKSRYDKGDGSDYLNIPLDQAQYRQFVTDLCLAPKHEPKEFEVDALQGKIPYFEGCLPVEEIAARGEDALRYGPMKPVGLRDPQTGQTPYAVVQLRKENARASAYNLVGFQTRLTWPAQKAVFGRLPGLENAEWLRYGVMHRNAFLDAPRLLTPDFCLRGRPHLRFAGQITGAEGYVEAAACGLLAGRAAAREWLGLAPIPTPADTALGAIVAHSQNTVTPNFQPSNVTWSWFSPLEKTIRDKRERRRQLAERALAHIATYAAAHNLLEAL